MTDSVATAVSDPASDPFPGLLSEEVAEEITEAEAGQAGSSSSGRRLSLITIDQVLSSLSNIVTLIWVAHAFDAVDFGRFSLILMVYTVAQVALHGDQIVRLLRIGVEIVQLLGIVALSLVGGDGRRVLLVNQGEGVVENELPLRCAQTDAAETESDVRTVDHGGEE